MRRISGTADINWEYTEVVNLMWRKVPLWSWGPKLEIEVKASTALWKPRLSYNRSLGWGCLMGLGVSIREPYLLWSTTRHPCKGYWSKFGRVPPRMYRPKGHMGMARLVNLHMYDPRWWWWSFSIFWVHGCDCIQLVRVRITKWSNRKITKITHICKNFFCRSLLNEYMFYTLNCSIGNLN